MFVFVKYVTFFDTLFMGLLYVSRVNGYLYIGEYISAVSIEYTSHFFSNFRVQIGLPFSEILGDYWSAVSIQSLT